MTVTLESYFNKLVSEMEQNKALPSESHLSELHKKVERLTNKIKELNSTKSSNGLPKQKSSVQPDKPMTLQEKRNLGQNIRNLPTQYLRGVWEIVNDGTFNQHKEELEFDIDTLPPKKCRELERYVNSKMSLMRKGGEIKEKKGGVKVARAGTTGLAAVSEKKVGKKGEKVNEKKIFNEMQVVK
jgi:Bromodomain extra-terminal - transcription regulation